MILFDENGGEVGEVYIESKDFNSTDRRLKEKIKDLAFRVNTIQYMSHAKKDSDYDNGWNSALDAISRELHLILERNTAEAYGSGEQLRGKKD